MQTRPAIAVGSRFRLPRIGAELLASLALLLQACSADPRPPSAQDPTTNAPPQLPAVATPGPSATPRPAAPRFTIRKSVEHGRIEDHGGLRVIRLWGTPEQRGRAQGQLVGGEAIDLLRRELVARFAPRPHLLAQARGLLGLMVAYPKDFAAELQAMFAAVEEQGIDLALPGFDRNLDAGDVRLVNAMDLVVQMGCSGFTVFGEQVVGGGVLTARNFDWPLTGAYLLENCCLIVQHPEDGDAFAAVTWPGYLGAVTGVNERGVAVFLHYGNSGGGTPRPGCYPTAVAAREILGQSDGESAFDVARDLLGRTCPPRGYLTRVVCPSAGAGGEHPARVFEVDRAGVSHRKAEELCVVTNHFLSRKRLQASADSEQRRRSIQGRLREELGRDDRRISVAEAWAALALVERSGRRFGTLHSLVFRSEPWVFELAIAAAGDGGGARAAPSHGVRYRLARDALFAAVK